MREEMKVSFNQSFLRESAKNLANAQSASITKIKSSPVRVKLTKAKDILNEAYSILALTAKKDRDISPAAEWLIDNYYIIQEQIVQIEQDFPIEYQRNIPLLDNGEHQTLPRVFELVLNMFTHTDNLIDIETLTNYVKSYQEEEPLMIGEIWAIPIMLRFVLILSLSERSERVLQRKHIKTDIKNLINTFSERDMREPGLINHELSNWLNKRKNVKDQLLLTELTNQLQNAGLLQDEQKRWLQYKFNQFDMTIEEALRIDAQKQSKLQVSIQNAVISLREISETDWSDFAEDCSIIEQILRLDPFGYYSDMDFQTRDSYRRGIEKLSRYSNYSEVEVAEKILQLCEEYKPSNNIDTSNILTDRSILKKHVGYYLKEEGQVEIENEIGYSKSISDRFIRMLKNNERYYLLGVWIVTIFFLAILWVVTDAIGEPPVISTIVLIIALFPALDLSVSSINRFFAFLLPPGILPKMNYENGIPDESRTLVVVPTLFSSPEDVRRQFEALEIRSLANSDPSLQFAILSDFTDA
ncbi:MAG: glycosyltransferase 36, partial [Balneolaceae bacterium]